MPVTLLTKYGLCSIFQVCLKHHLVNTNRFAALGTINFIFPPFLKLDLPMHAILTQHLNTCKFPNPHNFWVQSLVALSARFTYLVCLFLVLTFVLSLLCQTAICHHIRTLWMKGNLHEVVRWSMELVKLFCFVLFYHSLHVYHCQIGCMFFSLWFICVSKGEIFSSPAPLPTIIKLLCVKQQMRDALTFFTLGTVV